MQVLKSTKQAESIRVVQRFRNSDLSGPRPLTWWTGVLPLATKTRSQPLLNLSECSMEDVRSYFHNTWFLTESLFAGLQGSQAFFQPPAHGLRHPLIFYYGHPAVLYVNTMKRAGLLSKGIDENIEAEFEVGVDEMRWDDLQPPKTGFASVETVHQYRQEVFQTVDAILQDPNVISGLRDLSSNQSWSVPMAFEHERIHLETSSVLMRELPLHLVRHPEHFPTPHPAVHETSFPGGRPTFRKVTPKSSTVQLGKPRNFPTFGWDNEYGEKHVPISEFHVSDTQISNGMFYEFIQEGGYDRQEFWSADGWQYRKFRNAEQPKFWVRKPDGTLALRMIFSETETMPWKFPAIVNVFEAEAYCNWLKSKDGNDYRLLTEAEYQVISDYPSERASRQSPQDVDIIMRDMGDLNMNLLYSSEGPVDSNIHGNACHWVEDSFNPFPGFQEHELYDDFSLPCFDGEHTMIMGGCFISTGDYASKFARYHFRPHFHQHAGFRIVYGPSPRTSCENNQGPYAADCKGKSPYRTTAGANGDEAKTVGGQFQGDYENDQWVSRYLHLHYPPEARPKHIPEAAWNFPKRCATELILKAKSQDSAMGIALDLGCATGGSAFALSAEYSKVIGIDLGERFIKMANELKSNGSLAYRFTSEGDKKHEFTAQVSDSARPENIEFLVGDAMNLPELPKLDAILMGNLLCRVPNPKKLLQSLPRVLNKGALVMNASPFSWKPEFTPRSDWLGGGIARSAPNCTSAEGLHSEMERLGFTLLSEEDMPLAILHHDRFCELISASATIWRYEG